MLAPSAIWFCWNISNERSVRPFENFNLFPRPQALETVNPTTTNRNLKFWPLMETAIHNLNDSPWLHSPVWHFYYLPEARKASFFTYCFGVLDGACSSYLWLGRNEGMDLYRSPYITHYSSFRLLFHSFIPS